VPENIQHHSIQFFIISVLHQQPEGQLQMQHKGRQNNNNNNNNIFRLSLPCSQNVTVSFVAIAEK
jgi:hypothetical protein